MRRAEIRLTVELGPFFVSSAKPMDRNGATGHLVVDWFTLPNGGVWIRLRALQGLLPPIDWGETPIHGRGLERRLQRDLGEFALFQLAQSRPPGILKARFDW